jgi:glycosyltransferase involved in cell wall biosynthesis
MQPLVSIITPMYNNQAVIKETIESVLSQSYQNWELILVDDASNDKTTSIVESMQTMDNRIHLILQNTNRGAAEARNLGTKNAKGNYIAFLDSDDIWEKHKLEKQVKLLDSNITDVCFGSYEHMDSAGKSLNKKVYALPKLSYNKLLKANYIGNLTGIYNSDRIGKIYTKDLKKRQDWLLWLEALKRSENPAIGIEETIAYYRISECSLSSNKTNLIRHNFNVYRIGLGFSFFKSVFLMLQFFYEHLIIKQRLIKTINER